MSKEFWKATGVRCLRTFLTTILGVWTGGQLITEVDWKFTFISAISTTAYIFITCVLAGLPEVKLSNDMTEWMDADLAKDTADHSAEVEEDE